MAQPTPPKGPAKTVTSKFTTATTGNPYLQQAMKRRRIPADTFQPVPGKPGQVQVTQTRRAAPEYPYPDMDWGDRTPAYQLARSRMSQQLPPEEMQKWDNNRRYWENPQRVARYYGALQTLPPEQRANLPFDEAGLTQAYTRLAEHNRGIPQELWRSPEDEDYYSFLGTMQRPPEVLEPSYERAQSPDLTGLYPMPRAEAEQYFDVTGLQTQGDNVMIPASWLSGQTEQPEAPLQDMTNGIPTSTWNQLKPWQQFLLSASPAGSGAAMGGGQGAVMGLIAGGPAGAVAGGLLGGGLGGLFGLAADNPTAQKAISLLNLMDWTAEQTERALGLVSQIFDSTFDPATYGPVRDVFENLDAAWAAGHFTENVSFLPVNAQGELEAWEVASPTPTRTKVPDKGALSSLMLAEARKRLVQGESLENIEADFRSRVGMAYDVREAIGHMVLDPLNLLALGENALIKAGAKWAKNVPLMKAVDTVQEINKTRNVFNQAGGVDILGEYARNLRMMKPAELARFAPLSRFIAGVDDAGKLIDYANQPSARAAVAKAFQHLITLTPQSKANVLTYQLAQGLGTAIGEAQTAEDAARIVRAAANITPGQVVDGLESSNMMQWFESAEAQPVPQAVKAALPVVEQLETTWKANQGPKGAIALLQRAADAASTDGKRVAINDLIRMFGEAESKQDFERIYRGLAETIQRNVADGRVEKAALDEFLQGGYGKYAETARQFYGPDGNPFTLEQFKARLSAAVAQSVEQFAVQYFGVKPRGWYERASNAIKGFQTLAMLNTPTYLANNEINNLLTLAWDGLYGISRSSTRNAWIKSMGFDRESMRIGNTSADLGRIGVEIDNAKKQPYQMGEEIRRATNANRSKLEAQVATLAQKMSIFPRLGGALEKNASELAYYNAIRPYWDAIWKEGKGFDRMSKEFKTLAGYLDSLQPGTSKKIEQMIARSKTRAEIERSIFNGFKTNGIKDALSPEDMEVLHAVPGLVDEIDNGLKEARTPEDVRKVFYNARDKVVKQIRTETRKQARAKAEKLLTRMQVEGIAGGAAAFDEVIDARASALMQHFERMQAVADDIEARGLRGKERAAVWQRARAEEDAVFRAFEDEEAAKWLGMFQALGSTDVEANALLALLGEGSGDVQGLHSNWRRFFTQTAEEYANFHALPDDMPKAEKSKAWDEMNTRLNEEYNQAILEEDRVMERIDELTARLYARGKKDATYAHRDMLNWRLSQRDVRRKMAATMAYYRSGKMPAGMEDWVDAVLIERVRGFTRGAPLHKIPFDERAVQNEWFYKEIYRPLIAEQAQVGHATQPKAPKPPATPAQPAQPQPPTQPRPQGGRGRGQGQPQPEQPAMVQTPRQEAPRVDQTALWRRIAETKPEINGVLPDGQFDPTAKLRALKFVKKNGFGKTRTFNEITPEMWDQAVKNEQLRAKAQPSLVDRTTERRTAENADLREAFDAFTADARALGLNDAQIRKALPNLIRDRETKALTYIVYEAAFDNLVSQGKTPHVAGMDLRGLHMTNKNFGDAVGNAYIAQVQRVAEDMGLKFLSRRREGGDEFIAISDDPTKLQAQMQELSDRFERSIIVVDGKEYDGLKLHWGLTTGPDAEQTASAAIDASTAARNADADWNARVSGREYSLARREGAGSAEGVDVRATEPVAEDGAADAGRAETGAAERAAAAATDGELKAAETDAAIEEIAGSAPDGSVLINEAGEVVDPRDFIEEEIRPPAPNTLGASQNEINFVRGGMHPFKREEIDAARVYTSELAQSRSVKIKSPDGGYVKVWENPPHWYKPHYESLRAEDTAFNTTNQAAIKRDKHKPKNTPNRVVRSNKAGRMHGQVARALEYIILDKEPPKNAPVLKEWIGWVRGHIAFSMTNPQEAFNPEFAWWIGKKDVVLDVYGEKIANLLNDPNATEQTVIDALGPKGGEYIDEYLIRQSEDTVDADQVPTVNPEALEDTALRLADNIDEAEAQIDIEQQFTRTKDDFERAVMDAMPDDGDLVIDLVDSLARNFNPEIDTQAFYDRLGWRMGGEFAGEEGLQRAIPDRPVDGLTTFTEGGRALMRVYKATDPTAAAHELIHGITPLMRQSDADLLRAELFADMDLPEDWHTQMAYTSDAKQLTAVYGDAYERLSNAFSRYLADGKAPTTGLQGLFNRMKNWMLAVYKRIAGGELDIEISPATREMFDRWVAGETQTPEPIILRDPNSPKIKDAKQITDADYTALTKASQDVQFLIVKNGGIATKSMIEDYLIERYGLDRGFWHSMLNRNEYDNVRTFVTQDRKVYWNQAEVSRSEPSLDQYPGLGKMVGVSEPQPPTPETPAQIAPEAQAADNLDVPAREPEPSLWDAPENQLSLFGEKEAPWQLKAQSAQAETFAPRAEGQQPALIDMREQLPTIGARQAEGGAEGTPLFADTSQPGALDAVGDTGASPEMTGATRVAEAAPIQSVQSWKDYRKRLAAGEINAEQNRAAYQSFLDNRDAIKAELSKMTVAELQKGSARRGNKSDLIEYRLDSMEDSFAMTGYTWSPFGETRSGAIRRAVESLTDEKLGEIVAKNRESSEKLVRSLTEPQTLDEFRTFVAYRGDKALTTEQRARFDELVATERRGAQAAPAEKAATIAPAETKINATLKETTKRKDGTPIWVVQMGERVERDVFHDLNTKAKKLNGYYSNFVKADAGFTFSTREDAEQFMKLLQGEEVNRAPEAQAKVEIKKNAAAEKMRALADSMEAKGNEVLGRDRLVNTARRARMAEGAESDAHAQIALAKTLRNLADAIANGDAVHLDGISTRTQVEALDSVLRIATYDAERANPTGQYGRMETNRPPTAQDIDLVRYPYPQWSRSYMQDVEQELTGKKGFANDIRTLKRYVSGEDWTKLTTQDAIDALDHVSKEIKSSHYWNTNLDTYKRIKAAGFDTIEELRAGLREYLQYRTNKPGADKIKAMERNLLGVDIPGYFPTPRALAEELVRQADIQPGMSVLEPSAGKGNIADAIKDAAPDVQLDVIEWDSRLRGILQEKGYNVVGDDTFAHTGQYDRIVMNPPFENGADIEHVMKAYDMLKPGGRLVAIMSEGPFFRGDRKAESFRYWLDERRGTSETNPEGSFLKGERSTGVNTRTVVIDKPGRSEGLLFRVSPQPENPQASFLREQLERYRKVLAETPNDTWENKNIRSNAQEHIDNFQAELDQLLASSPEPASNTPPPLDTHDLPVGTVDQLSSPPTEEAALEMLRNRILPMLDKAETTLAGEATRGNKLFDFENLDPEMRKQLRAYLGKVGGQMGDAKLQALRYGKAKRDFALLPYERRYNADTYLQGIMPYEFWYTRSIVNWMVRAANKPQIIANYMRLMQFFNEQQGREGGMPTRLRKKSFIRLPFLPEWMGEGVYIDPYRQAFPFLQLTGPFERMYDQENQAARRAESLLQQQVEDGTLDAAEAQQAIQTRSGLTWQEAMAQAKNEIDADVQNPLDFARMISGFSLPANILYLYSQGRQDEISQLPSTRLVQNITAPLGIGGPRGLNLEAGIRNMAGLPEVDRFEDYRVDRMLAGMAADGDISAEDAQRAMIDRQGPAFELAQRKVSAMGAFQYFGAPLALDFFPEGEQELRALRDVYNTAYQKYKNGDKQALSKFFDKHPEYQARMASFQEPEERMKRFLISEVWERYNALPSIYKKQTREQLGTTFEDAFLSKETRSYDAIKPETLAMWARAIGTDNLPNRTPDTPQIGLKFAPAETAAAVEQYNAEADRLFPGISQFLASFYEMPQEDQDAARRQYPQIAAYYSWKNKYLAQHPDVIPWVTGEKSELYGMPQEIQAGVYQYRAMKDDLFPGIDATQTGYFDAPDQKAYGRQHPELYEYWDWRRAMAAQQPKLAPYILSDQALSKAILEPNPTDMLTQDELAQFSPVTVKHLYAFFYTKEPLRSGPLGELDEIWRGMGQPYGTLRKWIDGPVRATLTGG